MKTPTNLRKRTMKIVQKLCNKRIEPRFSEKEEWKSMSLVDRNRYRETIAKQLSRMNSNSVSSVLLDLGQASRTISTVDSTILQLNEFQRLVNNLTAENMLPFVQLHNSTIVEHFPVYDNAIPSIHGVIKNSCSLTYFKSISNVPEILSEPKVLFEIVARDTNKLIEEVATKMDVYVHSITMAPSMLTDSIIEVFEKFNNLLGVLTILQIDPASMKNTIGSELQRIIGQTLNPDFKSYLNSLADKPRIATDPFGLIEYVRQCLDKNPPIMTVAHPLALATHPDQFDGNMSANAAVWKATPPRYPTAVQGRYPARPPFVKEEYLAATSTYPSYGFVTRGYQGKTRPDNFKKSQDNRRGHYGKPHAFKDNRRFGQAKHQGNNGHRKDNRRKNSQAVSIVNNKNSVYLHPYICDSADDDVIHAHHLEIPDNLVNVKKGMLDCGCNRTVTPLLSELSNTADTQVTVHGFNSVTSKVTTKGELRGLPAIHDITCRQTLLATKDVIKTANVSIVLTENTAYLIDINDMRAYIEKMRKSKRIIQEVPADSRGLFMMDMPESFHRDPTDNVIDKLHLRRPVWGTNSIGAQAHSIGAVESNFSELVEEQDFDTAVQALMLETGDADPVTTETIDCNPLEVCALRYNDLQHLQESIDAHMAWFTTYMASKSLQETEIHVNYSNIVLPLRRRLHKLVAHVEHPELKLKGALLPLQRDDKEKKDPLRQTKKERKQHSHDHDWCDVCKRIKMQNPTMGSGPYCIPIGLQPMNELYIDAMQKTNPRGPLDIGYNWIITDRKTGNVFPMGSSDKSGKGDFIIRLKRFIHKYNPYLNDPDKCRIKGLYYDGDGVFAGDIYQRLLGIYHIKPMPVPSRQHFLNGMIERKIQSLRIMANSYRDEYQVPSLFQYFAVVFACWAWNRIIHAGQTKSPHEQLYGEVPDLRFAFIPFCKVYILTYDSNKEKKVARPGFFIGYSENAPHHRTYDVAYYTERPNKQGLPAGRLEIIRNRYDVTFDESKGFGDLYPHLADQTSNEVQRVIQTNFGLKLQWIQAAYDKIKEVNVDGQPLHQPDAEHPEVIMHILDRPPTEDAHIVPDADWDDVSPEILSAPPPSRNIGVEPVLTATNLASPPPFNTITFPYRCPCGHPKDLGKINLKRHWKGPCTLYSSEQLTHANGPQSPRNPGSLLQQTEAHINEGRDEAVQPRHDSNPEEPPMEIVDNVSNDSRRETPVSDSAETQQATPMDIENISHDSEGSVQSTGGSKSQRRRNRRRRRSTSPKDPPIRSDNAEGDRQTDSPKGNKRRKREGKTRIPILNSHREIQFVDVPRRQKKTKVSQSRRQSHLSNPYIREYNKRHRHNPLTAETNIFHAFSAIYSHDEEACFKHNKRKGYVYDEMKAPKNIDEIQNRPDKEFWLSAIRTELAKHVGETVERDPNRIPTFHKAGPEDAYDPTKDKKYHLVWRFDVKTKFDEASQKLVITKRKCRVAIDGSTDISDVDYDSQYGTSKVVNATTTRILLSMAARYKLKSSQFDVAGAYLYGVLPKARRVFINAPILIDDPALGVTGVTPGDLCRVDTALYGLPDSSGYWAEKLLKEITSINSKLGTNFKTLEEDPCVLVHRRPRQGMDDEMILIPIYVDDLRHYYNNDKLYSEVMAELHKVFELDDRTNDEVYLGMSVKREGQHGAFHLNCETLITKVISKFNFENLQERQVPMVERATSENNKTKLVKDKYKTFRSILGAISFVAYSCRPDISYSTNKIARHQSSPDLRDWDDLMYLLGYLKATKSRGIRISGNWNHNKASNLTIYTDASFSDVVETLHSTYGYAAYLGGDLIYWTSTMTKSVCRSSAESELYALDKAVMNTIIPTTKLLDELKIRSRFPPMIRCDNQAAIDVLNTDKYVKRLKHTRIQIAFLRQEKRGYVDETTNIRQPPTFDTLHIGTKANGADIFTKILSPAVFPITRSLVFCNNWSI